MNKSLMHPHDIDIVELEIDSKIDPYRLGCCPLTEAYISLVPGFAGHRRPALGTLRAVAYLGALVSNEAGSVRWPYGSLSTS